MKCFVFTCNLIDNFRFWNLALKEETATDVSAADIYFMSVANLKPRGGQKELYIPCLEQIYLNVDA